MRIRNGGKKQEAEAQNTNAWITTYTDLMTLLLTFFVLLLSMSVRDFERERKALDSLVGAFGFMPGGRSPIGKPEGIDVREPTTPVLKGKPVNFEMLKEITMKHNLDPSVQILEEREKLIVRINQRVLFLPGSTEIAPEIQDYLAILSIYLRQSTDGIEIRGHTDSFEEVTDSGWPEKSWTISAERAQAVMIFFLNQGIENRRLSAHGFSYYHPIVDSLVYPNQRYKNQRVEVVLSPYNPVPSHLRRDKPRPAPYLQYKNFLFKLFPQS